MTQMMQIIIRMARKKETIDDIGSVNIAARTQGPHESSC